MRVSAVQMAATADRDQNLAAAEALCRKAVADGAELVVLPEMFNLFGGAEVLGAGAESLEGPTCTWASDFARSHSIWLVAGSFTERIDGRARHHNTSCLYDPSGARVAIYRKVHLFDNEVPGAAYHESATVEAGDEITLAEVAGHGLGMTICYDIRFPEIFRAETLAGAEMISLPMAFMERTGRDHMEPLMRARAIENEIFLIVADQFGQPLDDVEFHGHSAIVDPWGKVLARAGEGAGVITAELDFAEQEEIRAQLPVLENRRPNVYKGLGA
ncbi:MAG: hydrolase [Acidobacteria bacterium]|nr:MAG: hydrolase [Acidobacteriota bacterium]